MSKKKKNEKEVRYCPLLNKLCIQADCGWYMPKLDTCAVQVIPYNLYRHSAELSECSKDLNRIIDHMTGSRRNCK